MNRTDRDGRVRGNDTGGDGPCSDGNDSRCDYGSDTGSGGTRDIGRGDGSKKIIAADATARTALAALAAAAATKKGATAAAATNAANWHGGSDRHRGSGGKKSHWRRARQRPRRRRLQRSRRQPRDQQRQQQQQMPRWRPRQTPTAAAAATDVSAVAATNLSRAPLTCHHGGTVRRPWAAVVELADARGPLARAPTSPLLPAAAAAEAPPRLSCAPPGAVSVPPCPHRRPPPSHDRLQPAQHGAREGLLPPLIGAPLGAPPRQHRSRQHPQRPPAVIP